MTTTTDFAVTPDAETLMLAGLAAAADAHHAAQCAAEQASADYDLEPPHRSARPAAEDNWLRLNAVLLAEGVPPRDGDSAALKALAELPPAAVDSVIRWIRG